MAHPGNIVCRAVSETTKVKFRLMPTLDPPDDGVTETN